MRQAAIAIDFLVWVPVVTVVSFFVVLFAYGALVTIGEPFSRGPAQVVTSALLLAWPAWILLLAWNVGDDAPKPLRVAAGVAFAVPSTLLLLFVLNILNACNAEVAFPLGGSDGCPFR